MQISRLAHPQINQIGLSEWGKQVQQSPQKNFDIFVIVVGGLAFIAIVAHAFIQPENPLFGIPALFLFGLLWLYQGAKKVRAARTNQRPVHWYEQPGILMGISAFAAIPALVIGTFLDNSLRETILGLLLLVPTFGLIIAAIFFYFRGLWRKYTFQ